jgi:hypothetical protein
MKRKGILVTAGALIVVASFVLTLLILNYLYPS